ncbi:MAG TPA: hypothetical protein VMN81_11760 [Vicinamibacterales bacterium]|nr:hypothetical protein [Vicinamibacterales bacterium]
MTRRIFGALALVTTLGLGSAVAQESAVIVLRSGERVNASVVDLNAQGFHVRVNGTDRFIQPAEIAAISFAGDVGAADWNVLQEGNVVLVMRNGQTVVGELYDIGGTTPLRITMRVAGQDRDIPSNQVARIMWVRPANVAVPGTAGTGGGPGVIVAGNQQWVSSGITVRRGETLTFQSTGEVRLSADPNDVAPVTGARSQRRAAASPLPQHFAGALIGRIGNGAPFAIGDQTSIVMPAAGILWLGINDDVVADNAGQFNVVITRRGRR